MEHVLPMIADNAIAYIVSVALAAAVGWLTSQGTGIKQLRHTIEKSALITYRMAVYDEHFSVNEKLEAYELYRDSGGNHQTKDYMDSLLGEDVDVYLQRHGRK